MEEDEEKRKKSWSQMSHILTHTYKNNYNINYDILKEEHSIKKMQRK